MSRHQPAFKATQVFDWANEPSDERPTDFGSSTGFSALSGFASLQAAPNQARRRRQRRAGWAKLIVTTLLILVSSTVALMTLADHLRG